MVPVVQEALEDLIKVLPFRAAGLERRVRVHRNQGRSMERIGILGLGRMGREIARRMASQGAEVTGWTRSGMSADQAADLGIAAAESPAALAAVSDVILLSLFDDAAVGQVIDALMAADLSGKMIIDTSTVSPRLLSGYADRAGEADVMLSDAPIAGGPEMVADASCGVFVGGSAAAFARAEPALLLFSSRVVHTGPLGAGMGTKIVNNAMIAGLFATLSEIVQIAKRAGLEYETTLRVLANGPAGPPFLRARLDRALGLDDSVGFPISGVNKDVAVFRAAADELGVVAPMLARAAEIAGLARDEGLEARDAAAMIRAAWDRA